jgi:hypothetical protein
MLPTGSDWQESMMKTARWLLAAAALVLLPLASPAEETLYKSVDAAGNVTYSDEPPSDAAQIEDLQIRQGPTPEATQEAAERSERMTKEADARYDALMEQRRQQAEARQQAAATRQRELERQHAEQDDTDDDETVIYTWPPWPPHYHPHPHPPRPPIPPDPPPEPEPRPYLRGSP